MTRTSFQTNKKRLKRGMTEGYFDCHK